MARPKSAERKIAFSLTLNSRDAILFRILGSGNLSLGVEKLVILAKEAGILDKKLDKNIEAKYKANPLAAKEDDIFN